MKPRVLVVAALAATSCHGVELASSEQAVVTVLDSSTSIPSFSFGTVTGSVAHDFAIGPLTAGDDDILVALDFQNACPDFGLTYPPITGQEICGPSAMDTTDCEIVPFTVSFAPSAPGMQSCSISIQTSPASDPGTVEQLLFDVDGTGAMPEGFALQPSLLDFGTVTLNTSSAAQGFTLHDIGPSAITIDVTNDDTFPSAYAFSPGEPPGQIMLNPDEMAAFDVTCQPATLGPHDVHYSFSALGDTQTLTLQCTGTALELGSIPNPISFGTVVSGASATPIGAMFHNSGATPISISSIALSADADPDLSLGSIQLPLLVGPGATAGPIVVAYAASHPHDPGPLGRLDVVAAGQGASFPITGATLVASIGTNPASVQFGAICAGHAATQDVDVYASGKADVGLSLPGPAPQGFSATLGADIVHGGHVDTSTLTITATPDAQQLGPLAAEIVLGTDIPNQPEHTLAVTAIGVPMGITATPDAAAFGKIVKDTTSTAKRIDFSNCSGAPLVVMSASISGADASAFTLVSPTTDAIAKTLDDAMSETFLVVMSPHTTGAKVAQLDILASNGVTSVPLLGEGTAPAVDRETYYACATSRPATVWPVLIALGLVVRRRRATAGR